MTTTIVIPGKPFAKQRPRFSRLNNRSYTPAETVSFERAVGQIAAQHFAQPLVGPVRLEIVATFVPPQSWSRRKTADQLHRPHVQKPDADNLGKAICDGLNRIAFADDAQIADIRVRKVWGVTEQTVIHLEAMT